MFQLLANDFAHLNRSVDLDRAWPVVRVSTRRADVITADEHTRPYEQSGVEGALPGNVDEITIAHGSNTGKTGSQGIHHVAARPNRIIRDRLGQHDIARVSCDVS